ncbi:MAG: hypothetical protein SNJ70_05985 [Armatimonadota bacterium]
MTQNKYAIFSIVLFTFILVENSLFADSILFTPKGNTLKLGEFKIEGAVKPIDSYKSYFWLNVGFTEFELSANIFDSKERRTEVLINGQWNFLPETTYTPGIAFGFKDLFSQSKLGTGIFAAVSMTLPYESKLLENTKATVGVGLFGIKGPFAGLEKQLPNGFFLQSEYDSRDINAAFGWKIMDCLKIKTYLLKNEVYYGLEFRSIDL